MEHWNFIIQQANRNTISHNGQCDKHVKIQKSCEVRILRGEEINPTSDCYVVAVTASGIDKNTDYDNEEKNEIALGEKGLVEFLWVSVVDFGVVGLLGFGTHLILLGASSGFWWLIWKFLFLANGLSDFGL